MLSAPDWLPSLTDRPHFRCYRGVTHFLKWIAFWLVAKVQGTRYLYINVTASTSITTFVLGIFILLAFCNIARSSVFSFSRLGDFSRK